jgi:hypothetical protein
VNCGIRSDRWPSAAGLVPVQLFLYAVQRLDESMMTHGKELLRFTVCRNLDVQDAVGDPHTGGKDLSSSRIRFASQQALVDVTLVMVSVSLAP